MNVAIVQKDNNYRKTLEDILKAAGHAARGFADAQTLAEQRPGETFDLVLIDWEQLGAAAESLLGWLRNRFGASLTIIALSSWPKDADIVEALQAGADDHLAQSIAPSVLRARINAIARRVHAADHPTASERFGEFLFDIGNSQVSYRSEDIPVTAKEFTLALTLFRNLARPLSRAALLESLWGRDPDRPTRTLDSHMSKLRAKLGLRPDRGFRLTPIYGFGYRLDPAGAQPAPIAVGNLSESR